VPLFHHTGRRHGVFEIVRVAVLPFGEIDASTVGAEPGETDWHVGRARTRSAASRIAALLDESTGA
jgi:hypothetical protein